LCLRIVAADAASVNLQECVVCLCSAAADPAPLNRAEHLLYVAAFFNLEARAAALFRNISDAYNAAAAAATPAAAAPPTVLWLSYLSADTGGASASAAPPQGSTKTVTGDGWEVRCPLPAHRSAPKRRGPATSIIRAWCMLEHPCQ
jgi:hypothetical protein